MNKPKSHFNRQKCNSKKQNNKKFDRQEFSDSLITALTSALSDNFPDSLITFLSFLTPPKEFNLLALAGSSGGNASINDVIPLFFSENPDENFPNTITKYGDFLTTSSEPNILAADDQEVKFIWARHGSDNLIGFDPSTDHLGKRKIDIFTGDFTDEQLFGPLTGPVDESSFREWRDRFILGDWQQPYYVEEQPSNFGLKQFAFITDFNPSQDVIQLHGTRKDYRLVETELGTAIFWRQKTGFDLVALVG